MLYELVCLQRPFEARSLPALIMKILAGDYPPPPSDFSPEIHRLIKDLLQTNASSRPTLRALLSRPVLRCRIETFLLQQGERNLYQSARGAAHPEPRLVCLRVVCVLNTPALFCVTKLSRHVQPRHSETWLRCGWGRGACDEGRRVC